MSTSNAGASPRIYPRPEYPSAVHMIGLEIKQIGISSVFVGIVLCTVLLSSFQQLCAGLKVMLGEEWGSDRVVFAIIFSCCHLVCYTCINGCFGLLDYNGWLQEYKLERKPYMKKASDKILVKTLIEAYASQIIVAPIAMYYGFPQLQAMGMLDLTAPLPDIPTMALSFIVAHLFNDVFFYIAHRTFHSKLLYTTFHKQHHMYSGSIGIAAEYANPVEQIFANAGPSLGGVIFFGGAHPLVFLVWFCLRLKQTFEAHSGYCFKGTMYDKLGLSAADAAAHHDYHHAVNTGNFGVEWCDWLFGTQDGYCAGGGLQGYVNRKQKPTTSFSDNTKSK